MHDIARSRTSDVQDRSESNSDDLQLPEKQTPPKGPKKDPPDSPVISEYTNWKKLLVVGREKRSILKDSVKCALHIRREVKLETFINSALFHFTKGLVLGNAIQ
jgi:hypothetical protein